MLFKKILLSFFFISMIQLNPAPLDSQDFKIELNNKNRTLKNKKQVKFNDDNETNDNNDLNVNINRADFNYNYNSKNNVMPNLNGNKKIKDLSNLISKLHNKDESGEDTDNYTDYNTAYNKSNKFLDDTTIYTDKTLDEVNNKNKLDVNEVYNKNLDLMNYYNNYNTSNINNNDNNDNNIDITYKKYIDMNTRILGKLDNILNLLEEQKSEKTLYVTEELILYLFLGLFIIYIIDSFARAGKYVR